MDLGAAAEGVQLAWAAQVMLGTLLLFDLFITFLLLGAIKAHVEKSWWGNCSVLIAVIGLIVGIISVRLLVGVPLPWYSMPAMIFPWYFAIFSALTGCISIHGMIKFPLPSYSLRSLIDAMLLISVGLGFLAWLKWCFSE
jgi:hypothetical protein